MIDWQKANDQLRRELDEWKYVGNLLARIHRDGGHYIGKHGLRKATEDAEEIVLQERERIAKLESELDEVNKLLKLYEAGVVASVEEKDELRERIAKLEAELKARFDHPDLQGCGDHGCAVSAPKGQGTNSGCLCRADKLRGKVWYLEAQLAEARREIEALHNERKPNMNALLGSDEGDWE